MPHDFTTYVTSGCRFTASEQTTLLLWYSEFSTDDALKVIRRNLDRECARQDIDHRVLEEYLRDVAAQYQSGQPTPTAIMKRVFEVRRSHFLTPGCPLQMSGINLSRVMRLDCAFRSKLNA